MYKSKLGELDILRAFAAIAVIIIHVTSPAHSISFFPYKLIATTISDIACFAVPCFIFISGLVLFRSNYDGINNGVISFYKQRFGKILPIYLIFSIFYMILSRQEFQGNMVHVGLHIIVKLVKGGAYYHLWYFGLLFQLYLLFPFLLGFYKKQPRMTLLIAALVQLVWEMTGPRLATQLLHAPDPQGLCRIFIGSYIFYLVAGFYFLEKREQLLSKKYLGFILVLIPLRAYLLQVIDAGYLSTVTNIPFYTLLILFMYKVSLQLQENSMLKSIGNYSLEIYLIHAVVLLVLESMMYNVGITIEQLVYIPLMSLLVVGISYIGAFIFRKIYNAGFSFLFERKEKSLARN